MLSIAWAALVALFATGLAPVQAGYITVGMAEPRQCNTSIVEWYGDDGPYHLLLTPTTFVEYGYNVWVPTIANGTTSYELTIRQPAGMQFMVTVWGASGIEYAGTTDVLTVQPSLSNDKTCFLTDQQINSLYTFAFNLSSEISDNSFPPQCSNLTMSWPSSLEANISEYTPSDKRATDAQLEELADLEALQEPTIAVHGDDRAHSELAASKLAQYAAMRPRQVESSDTSSSNKTTGNTTSPPTMFGIIPLGNSFSIPITYDTHSRFAASLPPASLSDSPTTWTTKGVTHLNWTVSLAKGTRFILVAGIGSQEQWASGGSSEMLTVGQGSGSCSNNADVTPGITASLSSTGRLTKPTESGKNAPATTEPSRARNWVGVIVACVFSILGTLVLVCLFCLCCRVRRHRRLASKQGQPKPSVLNVATFGRLDTKRGPTRVSRYSPAPGEHGQDTPLDLFAERDDASDATPPPSAVSRRSGHDNFVPPSPRFSSGAEFTNSPPDSHRDLYQDIPLGAYGAPAVHPSRTTFYDESASSYPYGYTRTNSPLSSPSRPERDVRNQSMDRVSDLRTDIMGGRNSSVDGLVAYPPLPHTPSIEQNTNPRRGPLILHGGVPSDAEHGAETNEEDLGDLKRDTLAILGGPSGAGGATRSLDGTAPTRRRNRSRDDQATFLVHRDAGRLAGAGPSRPGRVLELPPRYEELDWDDERLAEPAPLSPHMTPHMSPQIAPQMEADIGADTGTDGLPRGAAPPARRTRTVPVPPPSGYSSGQERDQRQGTM